MGENEKTQKKKKLNINKCIKIRLKRNEWFVGCFSILKRKMDEIQGSLK